MRVLGIDCGTERTGYGLIESDGTRHRLVAAGVITASREEGLAARLRIMAEGLREVIGAHAPDSAAVEEVFYARNASSAIKLAHARGVALLALAEAGLDVGEYSALEVKTSVVGYGRAEKSQVQAMVQSLLGLPEALKSKDASDAVAVAICHATHRAARARIAGRACC